MAVNRKAAMSRREKERSRQQKHKDKAEKRVQRREEKKQRGPGDPGVDPDIADIVPGPQALEEEPGEETAEEPGEE